MARLGLALIGLMYLGLAAWCMARPQATSQTIGLTRQPGQGESEYLVIYGGLQLALGLSFLLPIPRPEILTPMLAVCTIVHACLVATRLASLILFTGFERTTYLLASCEIGLLALSAGLLWRTTRS